MSEHMGPDRYGHMLTVNDKIKASKISMYEVISNREGSNPNGDALMNDF